MSDDKRRKGTYMISAVAELYDIHPQTLRMYEREVVLSLTRDLGVNLAGVEVVLNMRRNMERLQNEVGRLMAFVRDELLENDPELRDRFDRALVRLERGTLAVRQPTPSPAGDADAGHGEDT